MPPVAASIFRWAKRFSIPELYAISASILLAIWLIYWFGRSAVLRVARLHRIVSRRWIVSRLPGPWRRFHFIYLPNGLRWIDISTHHHGIAMVILFTANVIGLTLRIASWNEVQRRAGSFAIIHLIPLCTGLTFGLPADILHLDRQVMAWCHRWIGRLCVMHSLLHGSVLVPIVRASSLKTAEHIVPLAAGCCLVLIVPLTHARVLRHHMQFAMKCHYCLAAVAISTLAYHLIERQSVYRWYLLGGVCLWLIVSLGACVMTLFAHRRCRSFRHEVELSAFNGLLWLDIALPRYCVIYPGQYVQLCFPQAGVRARLQFVSLYVGFWEESATGRTLHLVVRPQSGLTRRLYESLRRRHLKHIDGDGKNYPGKAHQITKQPVIVFGPYGHTHNLDSFGTILFVVEDIGFYRTLSYIGMLVQASRDRRAMIRKVEVLWEVEDSRYGMHGI
ncbi:unnamed protein product [Penicillium salamii]|uniref:FAD-binding FR-type domain-containing protein n=1 Tax=Penicillium salamii TaxID=1612424 RepID=A0A9W4IZ76_9EURO|nr:unnamed protein product [Penicillium salamii]